MKTCLIIFTVFVVSYLFIVPVAYAKVWINEFSSSGSEDWVELYNDSDESASLDGQRLRDGSATNKIELSGDIEAKGYALFDWGNKLTNSGDTIKLVSASDENSVIDLVIYGESGDIVAPSAGQTAGRIGNGSSVWSLFSNGTKSTTNADALPAPTPTTESEKTPTPTKQPTPTRTPTPKKTPTPTKSPKVAAGFASGDDDEDKTVAAFTKKTTATVSKTVPISGVPTSILGFSSKSATPKPKARITGKASKEVMVKGAVTPPYFIIASGIIFCVACGILVFLRIRKNRVQ